MRKKRDPGDGVTRYQLDPPAGAPVENVLDDVINRGRALLALYRKKHPGGYWTDPEDPHGVHGAALDLELQIRLIMDVKADRHPPESDLEIGVAYGVAYERLRVWLDSWYVELGEKNSQNVSAGGKARAAKYSQYCEDWQRQYDKLKEDYPKLSHTWRCKRIASNHHEAVSGRTVSKHVKR